MKLLALVIICLLPAAAALEITAGEVAETVTIGGLDVPVQVTVTAPCSEIRETNPLSPVTPNTIVNLMSETDDVYAKVTGPTSVSLTCAFLDEEASETIEMKFSANPGALAGGHVGTFAATMGDFSDETTTSFTVNPMMILSITIDGRIAEVSSETNFTAEFPVEVDNFGNSDVRVRFASTEESPSGIMTLPAPALIAYDDFQQFVVKVQYTGEQQANDQISMAFQVIPEDVATGAIGDPQLANLIVRASDFHAGEALADYAQNKESPTGLVLPVLGLLAVALVSRR